MSFMSLWAGDIDSPENLTPHLGTLYSSIGHSNFQQEPRVCEELERVPVAELIEPFLLSKEAMQTAVAAAERQSLRLATTVVAIYTNNPPESEVLQAAGCALKFIGIFHKS